MSAAQTTVAVGIDLGGTFIKSGIVRRDGAVLHTESVPTEADRGPDHTVARIIDAARRLIDRARRDGCDVAGVGIGSPGTMDRKRGIVITPPNLPGWRNVALVEAMRGALGVPVVLDNDANNAALGEFLAGAGRGTRSLIMFTLGTGIGGGMILDGRLFRGANECGAELGHMIVVVGGRKCACGQYGCLEAYASASNTAARARERIAAGEASALKEVLDRGEGIVAELVAQAAAAGDALARSVWQETCEMLAAACINMRHSFDPDCILLAGGMSAAGEQLRGPVIEAYDRMTSPMLGPRPRILLAELGNDAGFMGSALSVFAEQDGGTTPQG